jgi:hypothetical protein
MQALTGVRKQEAALKAEREGLAERLRAAEADSTARVRQAVEVVEDLKVLASCMLVLYFAWNMHETLYICLKPSHSCSYIWKERKKFQLRGRLGPWLENNSQCTMSPLHTEVAARRRSRCCLFGQGQSRGPSP